MRIISSLQEIEEDCITTIELTVEDDSPDNSCRYFIVFLFVRGIGDKGGDLHNRKYEVRPNIKHRFWVNPVGEGTLDLFALKECRPSPDVTGPLDDLPDDVDPDYVQALEDISGRVETGYVLADFTDAVLPVKECGDFDRQRAIQEGALNRGILTGLGAGALTATLVGALDLGALGAAGTITLTGLGVVLVVAVVVGLVVYGLYLLLRDCCELGVDRSGVGRQGLPVAAPR